MPAVECGGAKRGRITVASSTVQTMTARNSGSNPLRSYLEVALPLGRCSGLSSERERSGGTAQERRSETLPEKRQFCVAVGAYFTVPRRRFMLGWRAAGTRLPPKELTWRPVLLPSITG